VVAVAAAAVVAVVADLSAPVVAVAAAVVVAVVAVADLSARVVGPGAAAAVSRKAVEGAGVEFPRRVFTATRGSLHQHGGSLQDGGFPTRRWFPGTLARCNAGRRFLLQDLQ